MIPKMIKVAWAWTNENLIQPVQEQLDKVDKEMDEYLDEVESRKKAQEQPDDR